MPSEHNKRIIAEFRANGGRVGGYYAPIPLILLTTVGARSGRAHTVPLAYVIDGAAHRLVTYASNRGADRNPDWFHNLAAEPDVTVELGTDRFAARASVVAGAEYARLRDVLVEQLSPASDIADHQTRTDRTVPIVTLELS